MFALDNVVDDILKIADKFIPDPAQKQQFELAVMQLKAQQDESDQKDRDGARQREVGAKDKINRNLAYIIIGSFIAMIVATLTGYSKADTVLAGTLIGYLSAKAEQVLTYYFGSTHSSNQKNDIIAAFTSGNLPWKK